MPKLLSNTDKPVKVMWGEDKIWKTESAFMSFIRGGIRRALWNRSPIKIKFILQNRIRIPRASPRGKLDSQWGATCALCKLVYPLKMIEVDHRTGGHSLKSLNDLQSFVEGIVCIEADDLQLVCKPCHKIKSHSEKQGISIRDSRISKMVIELIKTKQDKIWLEDKGIVPESNQIKRKQQIMLHLGETLE
jgi:hypothetical protein